jgi:spore germination protein GerM
MDRQVDEEAGALKIEESDSQSYPVTIYLIQGDYLVPVTVSREYDALTPAEDALNALLGWNNSEWAASPLPLSTVINSVVTADGTVTIDFGGQTHFEGGTFKESLLLQSLVYTMTDLTGIDHVMITVDGAIQDAAFGHLDTSKPLQRPLAINREEQELQPDRVYITLWFLDPQGNFLVPVSRAIPSATSNSGTVLAELLKGPKKDSTLLATMPEGTVLLGASLDGSVYTLNFNRSFIDNHPKGTAAERHTLESLSLTLTELQQIEAIQLLVDGLSGQALLGHIDTSQPLVRPIPNIFH